MSAEVAPPLSEGRYRLVGVLGEGGMSTVYSALDQRLGVHRAVKVLSPALSHHASIRKRFDAEARTTARLVHPNIVNVHDVGLDNGRAFIVLELMTGGSLMGRLDALGPLPPRMAVEVVSALMAALQYAHERGVIHRDVKPHNLLVDGDGVPKLTDFGIARLLTSDHGLTRTGAAIGTPAYMAPEQRGNASQVDARADVFGAGASLYTLLTGKEPFDIYAVELQSRLFAGIPESLAEIIRVATCYDPAGRYPTANAMLAELKRVAGDLPETPPDTPPLGTPLPGPRVVLPHPTAAPESDSQHTFFTPPPDDVHGEGPVNLAAFPSLSGVEVQPRPGGSDVERSLNGEESAQSPWHTALRSPAFVALMLGAVIMAGLVFFALYAAQQRHKVAPPAAQDVVTQPVEPRPSEQVQPGAVTPAPDATSTPGGETPTANTGATTQPSTPSTGQTATRTTPSGNNGGRSTPSTPATTTTTPTAPTPKPVSITPSSTPPAAAPAGKGSIIISSKPRADVFIDDIYTARTKWLGSLQAGTYTVLLESDDGLTWKGQINIQAGTETRICRDLKTNQGC